jgi:polyphenol oxidase
MIWSGVTKIDLIHSPMLSAYGEIVHFSTTRGGGVSEGNYASLNLSLYTGDDLSAVAVNRQRLCDEIGVSPDRFVVSNQTHSDRIAIIDQPFFELDASQQAGRLGGVDALITNLPQVCVGVTTADCVPILLYDPAKKVAAAIHAGWRGTVARIAGNAVRAMADSFGSDPSGIIACICPSIGPEAFEVGEEVAQEFLSSGLADTILHQYAKPHIDLWKANAQVLAEAGLDPKHISQSGICTFTHHDTYFSARRLGIRSGRCISGIMIK